MKNAHTLFTLLGALLLVSACKTTFDVKHVEQTDPIKGVMRYALPKNLTLVKAKIQKTTTKPGKYVNETLVNTDKDFGLIIENLNYDLKVNGFFKKLPPSKMEKSYKFKELALADTFVADKNKIYEITHKKRWNKKSTLTISTSPRSIIQGVKIDETDQTLDMVTAYGSAAARIVGSFLKDGDTGKSTLTVPSKTLDEIYNTTTNDEVRIAASSAIELKTVKKQITYLKSGEAIALVQDKGLYDESLKKFEDREKELMALFTTTTETKDYELVMVVDYSKTSTVPELLCQIDPKKGVNLPCSTKIVLTDTVGLMTTATLAQDTPVVNIKYNFAPIQNQIITTTTTTDTTGNRVGGIRYRIPVFVQLDIYNNKNLLKSNVLPVAQLGKVVALPKKMNVADITFYENIGLIKSITGGSNPLTKDQISTTADMFEKIDSAFPSETDKLDKEVKLLELQKKKKDLEAELGKD